MPETFDLPHGRVEIDDRPGYLYVVESGTLRSVAEVEQYVSLIESAVQRKGLRRVLIDSRGTEPVGRDDGVRNALWKWLVSGRGFEQMAFVLSSELQVTSVNMVALSERAPIRAFATIHEAHRWLNARPRTMSQTLSAPISSIPAPAPTVAARSDAPRRELPAPDADHAVGGAESSRPALRRTGQHAPATRARAVTRDLSVPRVSETPRSDAPGGVGPDET